MAILRGPLALTGGAGAREPIARGEKIFNHVSRTVAPCCCLLFLSFPRLGSLLEVRATHPTRPREASFYHPAARVQTSDSQCGNNKMPGITYSKSMAEQWGRLPATTSRHRHFYVYLSDSSSSSSAVFFPWLSYASFIFLYLSLRFCPPRNSSTGLIIHFKEYQFFDTNELCLRMIRKLYYSLINKNYV